MAGWRDIKAKASAKVHSTFECPAVYIPTASSALLAVRLDVRIHTKVSQIENEFVWPGASQISEIQPRIIFQKYQLAMTRQNALVIVSATEIYRLGPAEPERAGYYRAECTRLDAAECQQTVTALGAVSGPIWDGVLP